MFVVSNNNMPRQSASVTATVVDAIAAAAAAAAAVERKAIASSIVRRTFYYRNVDDRAKTGRVIKCLQTKRKKRVMDTPDARQRPRVIMSVCVYMNRRILVRW